MSDTKALLLTDIVDSTKLSEHLGDRKMAQVWAAHDRAARDLLPRWCGREIDKTDGMLLLFDGAADAVGYALDYHRALTTLPVALKARAGLHVGAVILRENSAADVARGAKPLEVDGLAKPIAARVMSLARGGQTLLTPEAMEALGACELRSRSHGHWVMKGVSEPIELFEVGDGAAPFVPPADGEKVYRVVRSGERWLPVRQIPNNLPEQLTSFVGRERELAELRDLLTRSRLLTLLGMGGLGKTRLSLQIAAELMAEFADGAWFIDLAPLRDGSLVVSEAAQALGVREEPGRPLLQTLCAHLKSRRVLVILDNCEHLLKPAALLAHAILKAAPKTVIVASSREALRVPGERLYPIQPLPVPGRDDDIQTLARSPAVRMFVDRAQEHRSDFDLSAADASAIGELVARLEGIPLALELAAARVRTMSVAEISRGLDQRYQVLTEGSIVLEERQQTLRALVDWSYDLLGVPEQAALQRLAVFAGGFDIEAATPVCASAPVAADQVPALLESLAQKSLIGLEHRADRPRYRMLETIRDYAGERLTESGERAPTAARHCECFFVLSKQARDGMQGPEQGAWLDRMDVEIDNLRAALGVAQAAQSGVDPFVAVKMAVALQNFWIMRGHVTEGRAVVKALLGLPAVQASETAQAHALYVGAALAVAQSDFAPALRLLEDCLDLRRRFGDPYDIATTLSTLAVSRISSGDAQGARKVGAEALALFRQLGYRVGVAISLLQLGQIELWCERKLEARTHLHESLAMARAIGHPETEGEAEAVLGALALDEGDVDGAEQALARSLAVCERAGDMRGTANARWGLGRVDLLRGRLDTAAARLRDALTAFDGFEMREPWLACLEDHAGLAICSGRRALAVGLAAAAQRAREAARLVRSPQANRRHEALLAELHSACSDDEFEFAWQQGQGWENAEAQRRALEVDAAIPQLLG